MRFRLIVILGILCIVSIVGGLLWFVNSLVQNALMPHDATTTVVDSWKFAVIGDTEDMHDITQRMIDDMSAQSIDFVVHVGDISSNASVEKMTAVRDAFAQLSVPTYFVPGNNDLFFDEATQERSSATFTSVINQPLNQYILHNNTRLVLLDNSYRKYGFRDETLEWLEEQLKRDAAQPFTFLFFHRPFHLPLEDIFGDDETTRSRANNVKFLDILSRNSIDHIFTGHVHLYVPYTLDGIPATVTGGGGALPQAILGGASSAQFHYLIVHVPYDASQQPRIELKKFE